MGTTKHTEFSAEQNELAAITKALGHPARIAILEVLLKQDTCVCGDIVDELPLSQATISQHLKALKEVGLIQGTVEGRNICYCIDSAVWAKAQNLLTQLLEPGIARNVQCC